MSETPQNNVYDITIEDIMHTAYLQYSLSVNVGRAIPDVRDGMKPCNRRILYAMSQMHLTKAHKTVKCAKVVGAVLGSYHPHGDSSVYDCLVRMAQDFSMRVRLIEGQGNFGSIDGDPPAAYRYTECRMERITEQLLADIEKDTVNMVPTFDEETTEPEVLPAKFPNLLVNGAVGIGVGMATNIPTHNLGEVCNAAIYLLENPTATVRDLMQYVHGPDFPTGAIIRGVDQIRSFYETGRGVLKIRSKTEIVEKNGMEQIVVTEIPYALNKEMLVKRIADAVKDQQITGISGLHDHSNRQGIRIVIDVKKDAMAQVVLNQLFTQTQLETTFACNMLVVDHNRPRIMNLVQVMRAFLDHRFEVVTRRCQFELRKAQERVHILEGLHIAVENIDEVIRIIRESQTREIAGDTLRARFGLDKIQTEAILNMRLHQLTGLAIDTLEQELAELRAQINYLTDLLEHRDKMTELIKKELAEVRNLSDPRRTVITISDEDIDAEDLIPHHSCIITISDGGYIKRVAVSEYDLQHRNGKGIIASDAKEDHVKFMFNADSHDLAFFLTNYGNMYWRRVFEIPETKRTSKGKHISNLFKSTKPAAKKIAGPEPEEVEEEASTKEDTCTLVTLSKDMLEKPNLTLVIATRKGIIKKTPLRLFRNLRKAALRAITLLEDDEIIAAGIADGTSEIILSTAKGMACRFSESKLRPMGRTARGVRGIRFKLADDYLIGMAIIPTGLELTEPIPDAEQLDEEALTEDTAVDNDAAEMEEIPAEEEMTADADDAAADDDTELAEDLSKPQLLVITASGMGKRSFVEGYRMTNRGAFGVRNISLAESDTVISSILVDHDDQIVCISRKGQLIRTPVDTIRLVGRNSKGVHVMRLHEGDCVQGVSAITQIEEGASVQEVDPASGIFAAAGVSLVQNDETDDGSAASEGSEISDENNPDVTDADSYDDAEEETEAQNDGNPDMNDVPF